MMQKQVHGKEGGVIMREKEREMSLEDQDDLLVIDENTIYEIDMHCMKCRQQSHWTEGKVPVKEKRSRK